MPPARSRLYGRDDVDPSSVGPGQRVSIDGGIDSSKNIIAMILATVLFIAVVVSYQYFSVTITRREEARRRTGSRHGHRRTRSRSQVSFTTRLRTLIRRWMTFLKLVISPPVKPSPPSTSSTSSTEALLKKITPRRTSKRRTLFSLPCLARQKEQPGSRRESRRALRPLLLNNEAMYTYTPRSPIDEKTQELLRSPDAFAEFSDPVRNMNFVRIQDEVQLRKERGEIWYEEPINSPEIPVVACVAPLALRKKSSLLREGDKPDDEQALIERSPGRVIYPPPPIVVPATPPSTDVDEKQNVIYYPSYDTTRPLSIIEEEDPDSPAPRSFFEICGDEDEDELRRRKIRLRFPLPSPIKASLQDDIDVFSIGSFSVSDESSDGSGH